MRIYTSMGMQLLVARRHKDQQKAGTLDCAHVVCNPRASRPYEHPVHRRTRTTAWQRRRRPLTGCMRSWLHCRRRRQETQHPRTPWCRQHRRGQRQPSLGQQGSWQVCMRSLALLRGTRVSDCGGPGTCGNLGRFARSRDYRCRCRCAGIMATAGSCGACTAQLRTGSGTRGTRQHLRQCHVTTQPRSTPKRSSTVRGTAEMNARSGVSVSSA
jgi:hypothetical protein